MPADPVPTDSPGQESSTLIELWQAWWRAFGLKAPLSGDIFQHLVNPSLLRDNAQWGIFNINTMRSPDPALEQQIVTEVASYGRQLGRLLEAVDVLARQQQHRDRLDPADQLALDELQDLAQKVAATKSRATVERVDRLVADVQELRRDPDKNRAALDRLKVALAVT
jgi:hypothetical protein